MGVESGGLPDVNDLAGMFGYVTAEDRERWAKAREQEAKKHVSTARQMADESMQAANRLAQQGITAKMHGEQQAASQQAREKSRGKRVRTTVTESFTDFEDRDTRTRIDDPGLDF